MTAEREKPTPKDKHHARKAESPAEPPMEATQPKNKGEAMSENQEPVGQAAPEGEKQEVEMITLPQQDYDALQQELENTRSKGNEYFEGWQRERADFSNYKKRVERDYANMGQALTGELIKKYLVVLDDLERALKTRPVNGEGADWAEGIELIYRKLQNIIESEGVVRIQAENQLFDPSQHEAISHEDDPDHESGEIIEVVQQGYRLGDRVLRPALVRVAR